MNRILKQEQIDFYQENGFVQVDNVLSPEELEELRAYIDEAMEAPPDNALHADRNGGAYYRVLNQKVNLWRDHGGMAKYSLHPRFAGMALELTGSDGIRLLHDHALFKMPGDSKPTPWHQDLTYWPLEGTGSLSIWITLDDVDESNGCMMFMPKSRTLGRLTPVSFLEPIDILEYAKGTEVEQAKPVIARMKAGSCTFHDSLTFHYAHANRTDKPRRVLAMIYIPDGTIYNGKPNPVLSNTGLTAGQPVRGGLYPLLAKR